jgi:hypothetical protein
MSLRSFFPLFLSFAFFAPGCFKDKGLDKIDARVEDPEPEPVPDGPIIKLDRPPEKDSAADVPVSDASDARVEAGPMRDGPVDSHPPDVARDAQVDSLPNTNRANGTICTAPAQCRSGFCVNGVCCNVACNNGCQACVRSRTDRADGTCGPAKDLERTPCGSSCVQVSNNVTAVLQKVCLAGECTVPPTPTEVERCTDPNPCVTVFCDDNAGKCVRLTCPTAGACCCRGPGDARSCVARTSCSTPRMCEP